MGWASGSDIAAVVIDAAKKAIKNTRTRQNFYKKFMKVMQEHDWDTLDEVTDIDPVWDRLFPREEEDDWT